MKYPTASLCLVECGCATHFISFFTDAKVQQEKIKQVHLKLKEVENALNNGF